MARPSPVPFSNDAVERLEEAVEFGRRNAAAFILDRDAQLFLAAASLALRRQQETAAGGHRAQTVGGEVPEDLADLVLVRLEPNRIGRQVDFDKVILAHIRAVAQQRRGVLQDPAECRGVQARGAAGARMRGTSLIVSLSRSDSRSTISINWACSSLSGSSCRSTWIDPDIEASGLRISWAMPAAISPTAASRCCMRAPRSNRLTSVTSWNVKRYPLLPSGSGSVVAVRPMSSSTAIGRAVLMIGAMAARFAERREGAP